MTLDSCVAAFCFLKAGFRVLLLQKANDKGSDNKYSDEPVMIHDVSAEDMKNLGCTKYWVRCTYPPLEEYPDLEEKQEWALMDEVYKVCQACVDDPDHPDDENFLLQFFRDHAKDIPVFIASHLAVMVMGRSFGIVFGTQSYSSFKQEFNTSPSVLELKRRLRGEPVEAKAKPKSLSAKLKSVPGSGHNCKNDHMAFSLSFKKLDTNHYFLQDRKWSNARCMVCKVLFETDANKMTAEWKQSVCTMKVPQIPQNRESQCVYVCTQYDLEKSNCGMFQCDLCSKKSLNIATTSGSRRSGTSRKR